MPCILVLALLYSAFAFGQKDTASLKEFNIADRDTSSYNVVFMKVDVPARVDAGLWRSHLENALLPALERAIRMGLPSGKYVVQVKFLVERDGSISDVAALNDPGFNLAMEAVKILKTGPQWTPGMQNGQKVRTYLTQPITFVVTK